jgi:hypothetical protein
VGRGKRLFTKKRSKDIMKEEDISLFNLEEPLYCIYYCADYKDKHPLRKELYNIN